MTRDILDAAIEAQPDMCVVGHLAQDDLADSIERYAPDVVILKEHGAAGQMTSTQMLLAHPRLKLVILSADDRYATLVELRQSRVTDPSPATLIGAIRTALEG